MYLQCIHIPNDCQKYKAMFQNKRAVSDTVNSATQQQQGCPKLRTADSLLNTKGEVHKDTRFHCREELPKRKVVKVLKYCSVSYFIITASETFSFLVFKSELSGFSSEDLAVVIHPKLTFFTMFNKH